jgi:Flp pilus assembly pilin Flp
MGKLAIPVHLIKSAFDKHAYTGHHGESCQDFASGPSRAAGGDSMVKLWSRFWIDDEGQDIAEYAVMLAVILVLVVGTIRLIGSNANTVFSQAASSIQ